MIWVLVIELMFSEGSVKLRDDYAHFTLAACKLQIERLSIAMLHVNTTWRMTCEASSVEREV